MKGLLSTAEMTSGYIDRGEQTIMGKRKNIKTTIKQAVDYWFARMSESGLSVDGAEADKRCWRCGCEEIYSDAILFRIPWEE